MSSATEELEPEDQVIGGFLGRHLFVHASCFVSYTNVLSFIGTEISKSE